MKFIKNIDNLKVIQDLYKSVKNTDGYVIIINQNMTLNKIPSNDTYKFVAWDTKFPTIYSKDCVNDTLNNYLENNPNMNGTIVTYMSWINTQINSIDLLLKNHA